MVDGVVDVAEAAELGIVARQYHLIFSCRSEKSVVLIALKGCPVEHKYQVAAHEGKHLVGILVPELHHRERLKVVHVAHQLDHGIVKRVKLAIAQLLAVDEIPLATRVLVAPAIAFSREVNPLGMSELIAHEVEVSAVDSGESDKAYHLVHGYATVDSGIVIAFHHVPVHLVVDQPEYNSLVAHQRLVMTFHIAYGLFIGTAVGKFPIY